MHNSLSIRKFWIHIKNYEHWAKCTLCNMFLDDLEYILTICPSPKRLTIWKAACCTWPISLPNWQQPSYSQILSCGSITHPTLTSHEWTMLTWAQARLLRIIISESAHLIWVLRCKHVIFKQTHTVNEIKQWWIDKLNARLHIDCRHAKIHPTLIKQVQSAWQYMLHTLSEMGFPPTTTQPNMGMGRKSLMEKGKRLLASRTPRVGLCHSGTSASACVLHLSFKSSCPKFT